MASRYSRSTADPAEAGSASAGQLPGLPGSYPDRLTPASNDDLTKNKIHRYVTASPPTLLGARNGFTGSGAKRSATEPVLPRKPFRTEDRAFAGVELQP